MNESYVTLQGWVGNDVDQREVGDTVCSSFRLGCTPRYLKGGEWTNGETSWFTVNCWRALGRNVADSVAKGDPVVVHGRVRVDVWEREGQPPSVSWIVDAIFVGHDLNRGTAAFLKSARSGGPDPLDEAVREMVHAVEPGGPRLDADGNEILERGEPAA
ncbi:single-stranded DNA-binding protein [Nocardioides marmorisolisilvae]|uniref:Single-stranded DNA-binding protein n=1 Tax=Nocardioides marmorisolisilvae TaxID=1542737 RepID=A0A3N0DT01_9ACTN|nr:single-stranded DNA-binding protein [Nocardioides marmorisolisilvae]RNL78759.1 single-stranded DNA-binding protein [Nocardioides marmorisolisilvae]